jgi:hypothetical protein
MGVREGLREREEGGMGVGSIREVGTPQDPKVPLQLAVT